MSAISFVLSEDSTWGDEALTSSTGDTLTSSTGENLTSWTGDDTLTSWTGDKFPSEVEGIMSCEGEVASTPTESGGE